MIDDILLDENYDLSFKDGDFEVGNASQQSLKLLLISFQGEWKENPAVGCGIEKAENGNITRFLEREIRDQLAADDFDIEKFELNENGIDIKGTYKQ